MIKNIILIITLATFILGAFGDCSIRNFYKDPTPWGTGNCTTDNNCNYPNGQCTNFTCVCGNKYGKPDCSYVRKISQLAGGLNIGLPFAGIGGVGNLYIQRMPQGIAQIVLMLIGAFFICIGGCIGCCAAASDSTACQITSSIVLGVMAVLLLLAGLGAFIWSIIDGANMLSCGLRDGLGYALSF